MAKAPKILHFKYTGLNKSGRKVQGKLQSASKGAAAAELSKQGLQRVKLQQTSAPPFQPKITGQDITIITRQLSTMLKAGVPVVQSLQLTANSHTKAPMRAMLNQIVTKVEGGNSLASALREHPQYFESFYCDLMESGEQTGHLEHSFERLATYREKSEELRRKVKKAMIYPSMIMLVAVIVTCVLLLFVIPQFDSIFKSFGADLPWLTQVMIDLSHGLSRNGPIFVIAIVLAVFMFISSYKKSINFKRRVTAFSLKIPVLGSIFQESAIARFSRTLATTFSSGIPLLDGIDLAASTSGNILYEEALISARNDTAGGMMFYLAIKHTNRFPELVTQMVMIGEESGALDEMLNKVASIYEDSVDNTVDNLSQLLEPMIMVIIVA